MNKSINLGPIRVGLRLLNFSERRFAIGLAAAMLLGTALEILSIGAVTPLVATLVEPTLVSKSAHLAFVDRLFGHPGHAALLMILTTAVLGTMVGAFAVNTLVQIYLARWASECQSRLAHDLMAECVNAPYGWFLKKNSTMLVRLINSDVAQWARGFVQRLVILFGNVVTMVFLMALTVASAPPSALLVLVAMSALAFGMYRIAGPRMRRLTDIKRLAADNMALSATQALVGIKDVKLSNNPGFFVELFRDAYSTAAFAHGRRALWQNIPATGLQYIGQASLVVLAIVLWMSGLSSGAIAATMALLVVVASRAISLLSRLAEAIGQLSESVVYVAGIIQLREEIARAHRVAATGDPDTLPDDWQTICFADVRYAYPEASAEALSGIDLTIERGKSYGIVGPSGAGKTSLVDVMLGLLPMSAGRVEVDGHQLRSIDIRTWRGRVGYVPQHPFIVDDTLRRNVAFGVDEPRIDDGRIIECLRHAELGDLLDSLPEGIATALGERGCRLSGGQRQRLAIARALYGGPDIMVLDEATNALDSINESRIQRVIDGLHGTVTTVVIAHRLNTIKNCDRIFIMADGCIVDAGTHDELLERSPMFRQLAAHAVEVDTDA